MDTSQLYLTTSCGPAMGDQNLGSTSSNAGGGGRRRRSREIETLSLEIRNYPRDLLQTFISTDRNTPRKQQSAMEEQGEEDEDLELNLGLSLGGRFGVDKSHRGLIRSSSIAGAIPCLREGGEEEEEEEEASVAPPAALARTSSLPTVTEEEWRRRKATLRRMEAKRRRSEKQRSVKESGGAGEERESGLGLSFRGRLEREQQHLGTPGKLNPGPGPGPGLPGPVKAIGGFFRSLQGLLAHQQQQLKGCSQGSGESQGGSSSAASELENRTHQGCGSGGEAKSRGSNQSMQMQERGSQEARMGSSSSKQAEASDHRKKEAGGSEMEDMPSVFTIGDGPSGRKVEGILYRYGRGEGVRIMCVCHGSFFSPAEFVMHAGGSDVDHPLRHIVVNPSSSPFA